MVLKVLICIFALSVSVAEADFPQCQDVTDEVCCAPRMLLTQCRSFCAAYAQQHCLDIWTNTQQTQAPVPPSTSAAPPPPTTAAPSTVAEAAVTQGSLPLAPSNVAEAGTAQSQVELGELAREPRVELGNLDRLVTPPTGNVALFGNLRRTPRPRRPLPQIQKKPIFGWWSSDPTARPVLLYPRIQKPTPPPPFGATPIFPPQPIPDSDVDSEEDDLGEPVDKFKGSGGPTRPGGPPPPPPETPPAFFRRRASLKL